VSWEAVIGIEIHVQLRTGRKLFCADRAVFGEAPNSCVCPVCLGLPGALPVPDPEAVTLALRTALALGCTAHTESVWARKNYFYPDLPKGYQITQFERPLATGGRLDFVADGQDRVVRIRRIHMEEDAGKSIHDRIPGRTGVDLNRAGTPLVEIVTEPDLGSPEDTRAFLGALKQTLEYVDVSDCNMEEGSLRADANVSIRRAGSVSLGTKTEIKNVNSFSGIERALRIEIGRQIACVEGGGAVSQETLVWDDHRGELRSMRSKEESHDYRYFPDPDLPPLVVGADEIERARAALPELPAARRARMAERYGLSPYDVEVLTQGVATADFFEAVVAEGAEPKMASNWVMGPVQALAHERGASGDAWALTPEALASLIGLVRAGTVSDAAARKLLPVLAAEGGDPAAMVEERGLTQVRDADRLEGWVDEVFAAHPEEVASLREGQSRIIGFLVGAVMRLSEGKADPRAVNELIRLRGERPSGP
jgi:aspartyl-tRNA(Asn)/glutamyl-tRNA(Gln) amidotransferase subunit B